MRVEEERLMYKESSDKLRKNSVNKNEINTEGLSNSSLKMSLVLRSSDIF